MTQTHIHQKWQLPGVEEITAIAEMEDPVLRNLMITQSYHELTAWLTKLFGDENVSWCAYAVWAQKQPAGLSEKILFLA